MLWDSDRCHSLVDKSEEPLDIQSRWPQGKCQLRTVTINSEELGTMLIHLGIPSARLGLSMTGTPPDTPPWHGTEDVKDQGSH